MTEQLGGRLGDLSAHIETASAKFEAETATLYRPDGTPLFAEDEHAARLDSLTRERNAALRQAGEDVREEMVKLDEHVEHLRARDVAERLSTEELQAAGDRRAFAMDAASTLGTGELADRMRSVLATGDKAAIFAYLNAGERKRAEILNARSSSAGGSSAGASSGTDLDGVLIAMRRSLDPTAESELAASTERQHKALQLQLLAGSLRQGARDSATAHMNRVYG